MIFLPAGDNFATETEHYFANGKLQTFSYTEDIWPIEYFIRSASSVTASTSATTSTLHYHRHRRTCVVAYCANNTDENIASR